MTRLFDVRLFMLASTLTVVSILVSLYILKRKNYTQLLQILTSIRSYTPIVERVSRYTAIIKVSSKEADAVSKAIINRMKTTTLPLHSMTGDNGTEFSEHQKIANKLGIDFYFTHPYSSWEKGTNENTNGLIRQYFPKGTDFANISAATLRQVEEALNDRPRKKLNYKTPKEVLGVRSE